MTQCWAPAGSFSEKGEIIRGGMATREGWSRLCGDGEFINVVEMWKDLPRPCGPNPSPEEGDDVSRPHQADFYPIFS